MPRYMLIKTQLAPHPSLYKFVSVANKAFYKSAGSFVAWSAGNQFVFGLLGTTCDSFKDYATLAPNFVMVKKLDRN